MRSLVKKDEISTRKLRHFNLNLVKEKESFSNMRILKRDSTIKLRIRTRRLKRLGLSMQTTRIVCKLRSKNSKRSMTHQWTNQHNKKLILKEKKLWKIKSFNSWNKEIKNTRINKLRLSNDTRKDSSKKKKKQQRQWMIESVECKLKKKVQILSMSKRERH